jgi:hypothetical protein
MRRRCRPKVVILIIERAVVDLAWFRLVVRPGEHRGLQDLSLSLT